MIFTLVLGLVGFVLISMPVIVFNTNMRLSDAGLLLYGIWLLMIMCGLDALVIGWANTYMPHHSILALCKSAFRLWFSIDKAKTVLLVCAYLVLIAIATGCLLLFLSGWHPQIGPLAGIILSIYVAVAVICVVYRRQAASILVSADDPSLPLSTVADRSRQFLNSSMDEKMSVGQWVIRPIATTIYISFLVALIGGIIWALLLSFMDPIRQQDIMPKIGIGILVILLLIAWIVPAILFSYRVVKAYAKFARNK